MYLYLYLQSEYLYSFLYTCILRTCAISDRQWRHQDFHSKGGTTNMFTKAGIHHRNVYIKKYDELAHLITHKMAWSFQRQASVRPISIKTVNDTSSVNRLYNIPFNTTKQKFLESVLSAARSQFILNQC